jgi:hypothetical protein
MSTNLCYKTCVHCGAELELRETPRLVTQEDAGGFFPRYKGMMVAKAECPDCLARYMAWMTDPPSFNYPVASRHPFDGTIYDLSYQSSFDDQPDPEDLPRYRIVVHTILRRVAFGTSESECPDTTERQWKP